MFKKIRKLFGTCLLIASLAVGSTVSVSAAVDNDANGDTYPVDSDSWAYWPQGPETLAVTACIMDLNTGAILYSKGMDAQRFPASITKIMTALVVVEHADLSTQVAFTETGLADAYGGSSNIGPQLGEVFTIDEMLQMLLVKSANDVATQLAECVGGSVEAFAELMNQKAAELGCTNTHFANASGLEDDNHYTSAHDMTLIMRAAIQYDRIREIMNAQSISIPETNMGVSRNYDTHLNMLVPGNQYYYEGALGGKTGYTPISGCTLVMYATRGDRTLIGVVMGSRDSTMGSDLICGAMADLFDYGFNYFSYTDMTGGYPYISGGAALLPITADPSAVTVIPAETAEGIALTYQLNGQTLGSGLMSREAYETWQTALNPEPQSQPEAENTVSAAGEEEELSAEKTEEPATKKKSRVILMYIAVGVLVLSILACIVLIILTSDGVQRRMRKRRRDR